MARRGGWGSPGVATPPGVRAQRALPRTAAGFGQRCVADTLLRLCPSQVAGEVGHPIEGPRLAGLTLHSEVSVVGRETLRMAPVGASGRPRWAVAA
jgi:hypothetical protein